MPLMVSMLTSRRFEAAWNGDLEKIKTLTLTWWDDEKVEPPLKIAVTDGQSNNPFSLAFFRGHYGVAKAVLEIVQAQYSPNEKSFGPARAEFANICLRVFGRSESTKFRTPSEPPAACMSL